MGIVFYFTAQPWSFLVFGVHDDSMGYVVQNRSWFGILFYYQAVMRAFRQEAPSQTNTHAWRHFKSATRAAARPSCCDLMSYPAGNSRHRGNIGSDAKRQMEDLLFHVLRGLLFWEG